MESLSIILDQTANSIELWSLSTSEYGELLEEEQKKLKSMETPQICQTWNLTRKKGIFFL